MTLFKINIPLSHTLKSFVPHGYVSVLSYACSLLSSLALNAILFTSSV